VACRSGITPAMGQEQDEIKNIKCGYNILRHGDFGKNNITIRHLQHKKLRTELITSRIPLLLRLHPDHLHLHRASSSGSLSSSSHSEACMDSNALSTNYNKIAVSCSPTSSSWTPVEFPPVPHTSDCLYCSTSRLSLGKYHHCSAEPHRHATTAPTPS